MAAPTRKDYDSDEAFKAAQDAYARGKAERDATQRQQSGGGWGFGTIIGIVVLGLIAVVSGGMALQNEGVRDWVKDNLGVEGMALANMFTGLFGEPVFSYDDMFTGKDSEGNYVLSDAKLKETIRGAFEGNELPEDVVQALASDREFLVTLLRDEAGLEITELTNAEKLKAKLLSPKALEAILTNPDIMEPLAESAVDSDAMEVTARAAMQTHQDIAGADFHLLGQAREVTYSIGGKQYTETIGIDYTALSAKLKAEGADMEAILTATIQGAIEQSTGWRLAIMNSITGADLKKELSERSVEELSEMINEMIDRKLANSPLDGEEINREQLQQAVRFLKDNVEQLDSLLGEEGWNHVATLMREGDYDALSTLVSVDGLFSSREALEGNEVSNAALQLAELMRARIAEEGIVGEQALASLNINAFADQEGNLPRGIQIVQALGKLSVFDADGQLDDRDTTTNLEWIVANPQALEIINGIIASTAETYEDIKSSEEKSAEAEDSQERKTWRESAADFAARNAPKIAIWADNTFGEERQEQMMALVEGLDVDNRAGAEFIELMSNGEITADALMENLEQQREAQQGQIAAMVERGMTREAAIEIVNSLYGTEESNDQYLNTYVEGKITDSVSQGAGRQ